MSLLRKGGRKAEPTESPHGLQRKALSEACCGLYEPWTEILSGTVGMFVRYVSLTFGRCAMDVCLAYFWPHCVQLRSDLIDAPTDVSTSLSNHTLEFVNDRSVRSPIASTRPLRIPGTRCADWSRVHLLVHNYYMPCLCRQSRKSLGDLGLAPTAVSKTRDLFASLLVRLLRVQPRCPPRVCHAMLLSPGRVGSGEGRTPLRAAGPPRLRARAEPTLGRLGRSVR